jgi:UDP-N-acetylglucosamine--N-acetylmuramyl-(pentapeptide) pyrophosphoryl-undecaprenol N-acetylglucosamine transferase
MLPYIARQSEWQLVYVTGGVHYEAIREAAQHRQVVDDECVKIVPFVYDMPALLQHTDLMVGRSGATAMAEVLALGIPCVYIPSPYVTNNHQEKNAELMVGKGAAEMIRERDLTGQGLYDTIDSLVRDANRLNQMGERARELGKPNSAEVYYQTLQALLRQR